MALKKEDIKTALELQAAQEEGFELVTDKIAKDAFEWFELLIENSKDKNYKLMAAKKIAFEVGVSHGMEQLYEVHVQMKKQLAGKKYFGSKEHSAMYAHLFLARAFSELFKEVEKRNNEQAGE